MEEAGYWGIGADKGEETAGCLSSVARRPVVAKNEEVDIGVTNITTSLNLQVSFESTPSPVPVSRFLAASTLHPAQDERIIPENFP